MTVTEEKTTKTYKDNTKDVTTLTLTADADASNWVEMADNVAIEFTGISADTIEMYATNDKSSSKTAGGDIIYPSILEDGMYVFDTNYSFINFRRVGAADGNIVINITT